MKQVLLLFSLLAGMSSCTLYEDVEVVRVGDIRITEMGKEGVSAEIDLTLNNPNSFKVKLVDSDIDVWVNEKEIGKVRLAEHMIINRKSSDDLVLKLYSNYDELSPDFLVTALGLLFAQSANFRAEGYVKGRAFMIGKKVDVSVQDEVELK